MQEGSPLEQVAALNNTLKQVLSLDEAAFRQALNDQQAAQQGLEALSQACWEVRMRLAGPFDAVSTTTVVAALKLEGEIELSPPAVAPRDEGAPTS
jgi:hypothetical protein